MDLQLQAFIVYSTFSLILINKLAEVLATMNVQVYFTVIFLVALSSSRLSMVGASPGSLSTAILMRVDQSGKGDYQKIQDAIDAVPSNNTEVVFIWVKPGIYRYFFFSICCLMHISERQAVEVIVSLLLQRKDCSTGRQALHNVKWHKSNYHNNNMERYWRDIWLPNIFCTGYWFCGTISHYSGDVS